MEKYKDHKKVTTCPQKVDNINTPCKQQLENAGLTCAKYCPKCIVNEPNRDKRLKMYHEACLTDENNIASLSAIVYKKKEAKNVKEKNCKIYPPEYYRKNKPNI